LVVSARRGGSAATRRRAQPAQPQETGDRMATKTSNEQPIINPGQAQQPKIIWDDSKMNTSYANVCNVLGTREEVTLLFGAHQAWRADQKEVRVLLSDRVVLNPYAAKRLMLMLEKGLKEYEAKFGELKV
jgi:hypothetical protein